MSVMSIFREVNFGMDEPYRERAALRPITGPFKSGGAEIRRLLGWEIGSARPFLSTRAAQNKTGISNGTIATMANGGKVSANLLEIFANRLSGDAEKLIQLFGYVSPEKIEAMYADPLSRIGPDVRMGQFTNLPLATGPASAGHEMPTDPCVEHEQFGDVVHGDVRTIRVEGDCMEPFYRHGDILFVQRSESAGSGDKIVAVLDGETVACKVYRQADEGDFLEATNGKYPKITGDFRIVGIVKGSYRP